VLNRDVSHSQGKVPPQRPLDNSSSISRRVRDERRDTIESHAILTTGSQPDRSPKVPDPGPETASGKRSEGVRTRRTNPGRESCRWRTRNQLRGRNNEEENFAPFDAFP